MSRELTDAASKGRNHWLGETWLIEIDDVLNHVVSKRILHKDSSMLRDARNEPRFLIARGMIDAALQHTTTMAVSAHLDAVIANRIEDKLRVQGGELIQALLNDVIAIEVLDQLDDAEAKGFDNEMDLLRSANVFNHLLQRSCSMLIECNSHHVLGRVLDQNGAFIVIAELEELLAQIITKGVRHELNDMLIGL